MKTNYKSKTTAGLENAKFMQSIFQGEVSEDVHLTLCPCLNKKAMLMSKSEISEVETLIYIRTIMDCDKLISTYVHNRLISTKGSSKTIFIGNYLDTYNHIYGILLLPD